MIEALSRPAPELSDEQEQHDDVGSEGDGTARQAGSDKGSVHLRPQNHTSARQLGAFDVTAASGYSRCVAEPERSEGPLA